MKPHNYKISTHFHAVIIKILASGEIKYYSPLRYIYIINFNVFSAKKPFSQFVFIIIIIEHNNARAKRKITKQNDEKSINCNQLCVCNFFIRFIGLESILNKQFSQKDAFQSSFESFLLLATCFLEKNKLKAHESWKILFFLDELKGKKVLKCRKWKNLMKSIEFCFPLTYSRYNDRFLAFLLSIM